MRRSVLRGLGARTGAPWRRRTLALWIPWAGLSTLLVGLLYGVVQQEYRTSANDPQWQLASAAAHALDAGTAPAQVAGGAPVDVTSNLAPHISVYDGADHLLASTARLAGSVPEPPSGVLATARSAGTNVLTWQPAPEARVAAVVVAYAHGTVLVGRSLSTVEAQETRLLHTCVLAELLLLLAGAGLAVLSARLWAPPAA